MYALVQFIVDNKKLIVPVSDIKNFKPDTFKENSHPVHEVFWSSVDNGTGTGYYKAVVLLVAETEEEVKERKRTVKFLHVKKLRELFDEVEPDETMKGLKSSKESRGKIKAKQEKRTACEKNKYLDILNEKIEGKKKRSLSNESKGASPFESQKYSSISPNESSDGDEMILKSELQKITADYKTVLRKLKIKENDYSELKKKYNKIQALNIDLQEQLVSFLKANRSVEYNPAPTQRRLSQQVESNERVVLNECHVEEKKKVERENLKEIPSASTDNLIITPSSSTITTDFNHQERVEKGESEMASVRTLEGNPSSNEMSGNLMQWKDEQLILAKNVTISRDQWSKVVASKKLNESRLARNIAITLWGSETLSQRSVTGAPCKRFPGGEGKTALTPEKIDAVQNGMRFWLKNHQGKTEEEVLELTSTPAVRKILGDKIMDLRRQANKLKKAKGDA